MLKQDHPPLFAPLNNRHYKLSHVTPSLTSRHSFGSLGYPAPHDPLPQSSSSRSPSFSPAPSRLMSLEPLSTSLSGPELSICSPFWAIEHNWIFEDRSNSYNNDGHIDQIHLHSTWMTFIHIRTQCNNTTECKERLLRPRRQIHLPFHMLKGVCAFHCSRQCD
jgi:hypothetical protein